MYESSFDQFWAAYPRKVAKGAARKAFQRAMSLTTLETILEALTWQRTQPQWMKDGGEFIPYPASWLNAERWADEPFETPMVKERTARTLTAVDQWIKRGA